jgi:hypothetical protein
VPFCFVEDRAIVIQEMVTVGVNFVGLNPMKVFGLSRNCAGIFNSSLMLLIMLMTNKRAIMRDQVQRGDERSWGLTTGSIFAAIAGLIITWIYLKLESADESESLFEHDPVV